jgi:hypothetical protein
MRWIRREAGADSPAEVKPIELLAVLQQKIADYRGFAVRPFRVIAPENQQR